MSQVHRYMAARPVTIRVSHDSRCVKLFNFPPTTYSDLQPVGQFVSNTPDSNKIPRFGRVVLNFFANFSCKYRDAARVSGIFVAPDVLHDLVARENASRFARQKLKQFDLARGKSDLLVPQANIVLAEEYLKVSHAIRSRAARLLRAGPAALAQTRVHAQDELLVVERLHQVIVGTCLEAD